MCVELPFRDLNSNPYPPHPTSIYTYRVTTALRVRGGEMWQCFELCNTITLLYRYMLHRSFVLSRTSKGMTCVSLLIYHWMAKLLLGIKYSWVDLTMGSFIVAPTPRCSSLVILKIWNTWLLISFISKTHLPCMYAWQLASLLSTTTEQVEWYEYLSLY